VLEFDEKRMVLAKQHVERKRLQQRITDAVDRATEAVRRADEDERFVEEAEAECIRSKFVAELLCEEKDALTADIKRKEQEIMDEGVHLRIKWLYLYHDTRQPEFHGFHRITVADPALGCHQLWYYIQGEDQKKDYVSNKAVWHPFTAVCVRAQLLNETFNHFDQYWRLTRPLPVEYQYDMDIGMQRLFVVVNEMVKCKGDVNDHNAMWNLLEEKGADTRCYLTSEVPQSAWPEQSLEAEAERLAAETRQNHAATVIQTRWRGIIARRRADHLAIVAELNHAATAIQARWRGISARRRAARLCYTQYLLESQEVQQRLALAKQKMEMLENGGHATKGGCVFYAGSAKGARHWSENEQQLGWHPNQTNRPQKVENDVNPLTASNPLEKLCIVCHKNKRNTVCLPCGCLVLCHECSDVITSGKYPNLCKCPHCQRRLEYTVCTVIP